VSRSPSKEKEHEEVRRCSHPLGCSLDGRCDRLGLVRRLGVRADRLLVEFVESAVEQFAELAEFVERLVVELVCAGFVVE
jgi:hypothetical protein